MPSKKRPRSSRRPYVKARKSTYSTNIAPKTRRIGFRSFNVMATKIETALLRSGVKLDGGNTSYKKETGGQSCDSRPTLWFFAPSQAWILLKGITMRKT